MTRSTTSPIFCVNAVCSGDSTRSLRFSSGLSASNRRPSASRCARPTWASLWHPPPSDESWARKKSLASRLRTQKCSTRSSSSASCPKWSESGATRGRPSIQAWTRTCTIITLRRSGARHEKRRWLSAWRTHWHTHRKMSGFEIRSALCPQLAPSPSLASCMTKSATWATLS